MYANNIDLVSINGLTEVYLIIIGLGFLAFLSWVVLGKCLKDRAKAAALVSLSFVMIFFYGHIQYFSENILEQVYFILIWISILALGIYGILRVKHNFIKLSPILFGVALTLIFLPIVDFISYQNSISSFRESNLNEGLDVNSEFYFDSSPDIYYIIFDKYASEKNLWEFYHYDNSPFLNKLEEKGFYVTSNSYSNYLETFQSVPSVVSMEYINYLSEIPGSSNNRGLAHEITQRCDVCKFLKERGYKYVHFGSKWAVTEKSELADININYYKDSLPPFTELLFETTMAYPILVGESSGEERDIARKSEEWDIQHYERVLYKFDKLKEIPNISEPTFVFAHFITPHKPYMFDDNGNYVPRDQRVVSQESQYVTQFSFLNKKILDLVDHLLEKSETPPIIIIQADEGPATLSRYSKDIEFDWNTGTMEDVKFKMGILNTFYLPGVDNSILYPSISSVNTFRVVLKLYFDTNLELLNDLHYVYKDADNVFDFINVTEKIYGDSFEKVNFDRGDFEKFDWTSIGIDDFEYQKYAHIADLLNVYYQRKDLQTAFPEVEMGNLENLFEWASIYGQGIYPELSKYEYIYDIMFVYNNRSTLQNKFPEAANSLNLTKLFCDASKVNKMDFYERYDAYRHVAKYKENCI